MNATHNINSATNPIISIRDYLRLWKLFSLACGIGILIVGSFIEEALDWDIPICFLMAISTYIFAPITSRTLFWRRWRYLPLALFGMWFSVDGIYWLYWRFKNPIVVDFMRDANFLPSLCLYLICAFIWLHDGSLKGILTKN